MDASDLQTSDYDSDANAPAAAIGLLSGAAAPIWAAILFAEKLKTGAEDRPVRGYLCGVGDGALSRLGALAARAQSGLAASGVEYEPIAHADIAVAAHLGAQRTAARRGAGEFFSVFFSSASGMLRGGAAALRRAVQDGPEYGGLAVVADGPADASGDAIAALRQVGVPILHPTTPIEAISACLAALETARASGKWIGVALPQTLAEAASCHPADAAALTELGAATWPTDQRTHGSVGARTGLVACGAAWAATDRALSLLRLGPDALEDLSLSVFRITETESLDRAALQTFAERADRIIAIQTNAHAEQLDAQIGAALCGLAGAPQLSALELTTEQFAAEELAVSLARLIGDHRGDLLDRAAAIQTDLAAAQAQPIVATEPPEHGSDAGAWIGAARYADEERRMIELNSDHLEDGGFAAIHATVRAGAQATFVIHWRDAPPEMRLARHEDDALAGRDLSDPAAPSAISARLFALGVENIAAVCDPAHPIDRRAFPSAVSVRTDGNFINLEAEFARSEGVCAILDLRSYAGSEATKPYRFAPDATVVAVNRAICDGCGDCDHVDPSCATMHRIATELGDVRRLDAEKPHLDGAMLPGSCPAFIGAANARRRPLLNDFAPPSQLIVPADDTGQVQAVGFVGGDQAVHAARILAAGARRAGSAVGLWAPTRAKDARYGLSALVRIAAPDVASERRLTAPPALGELNAAIVGLEDVAPPSSLFRSDAQRSTPKAPPAHEWSAAYFGDGSMTALIALGAAVQQGAVRADIQAIEDAIAMESIDGARDQAAFDLGRAKAEQPNDTPLVQSREPLELRELVAHHSAALAAYQDEAWAEKYRSEINVIAGAERSIAPGSRELTRAAANGLSVLMRYRDVYETARLVSETAEHAAREAFEPLDEGPVRPIVYLPSALLAGRDAHGAPKKAAFGSWILPALRLLKHGKIFRGGALDPLGWTQVRRLERALIDQYVRDLTAMARGLSPERLPIAVQIAKLPLKIRGFGKVKERAAAEVAPERAALWAKFRAAPSLLK